MSAGMQRAERINVPLLGRKPNPTRKRVGSLRPYLPQSCSDSSPSCRPCRLRTLSPSDPRHATRKESALTLKPKACGCVLEIVMNRNALHNVTRRPQVAEDMALLAVLRRSISERETAINETRSTIESTLAAIRLLDRLREGHPPSSSTIRKTTSL